MREIYTVQTDRKLPNEVRTQQKQTILNNGLEYYARFADKATAEKFVKRIEQATKIKLAIEISYPVTMKVL